jgi:hypothetical protein
MPTADLIKAVLAPSDMVVKMYLEDLSDADLLIRPCAGANHIAWQLGHTTASEHELIEMVCPGKMPPLPAGFAEKHTPETAKLDDPKAFLSKAEYLKQYSAQRAGTLAVLDQLSEEQLEAPTPEKIRMFAANVGAMFANQATHWMMHAGQWVIVRRKLGKPPLF